MAAPSISASAADIDTLARTIFGEARGETMTGQIAVAHVILNRVRVAKQYFAKNGKRHPLFGDASIEGACRARLQFSCWNAGDPTFKRMTSVTMSDPAFQGAMCAGLMALCGEVTDPTKGSTHYHTRAVSPAWSTGKAACVIIGAHLFFNSI